MSCIRTAVVVTAALTFLRIVIGLHFFLEGSSHLRDPSWSSAGFRKAAVGPLSSFLKADLPETGDWKNTVGQIQDADPAKVSDAAAGWRASPSPRRGATPTATGRRRAPQSAWCAPT